jgi:hypothetical protein
MSVTQYTQTPISDWVYQQPRKNPKNGLNVYINESAQSSNNPRIQLARGRVPFGIQDGQDPTAARKNLEMDVDDDEFADFLARVDSQNVDWITENSLSLFRREMDRGVVATVHRSLASVPTNPAYKPLLRIKVKTTGNEPTRIMIVEEDATETQPMKWREGTVDDLTKKCTVLPIVEVGGLWFVSSGCGMTFVATDLLVWPKIERQEWAFLGIQAQRVEPGSAPEPDATVLAASGDMGMSTFGIPAAIPLNDPSIAAASGISSVATGAAAAGFETNGADDADADAGSTMSD